MRCASLFCRQRFATVQLHAAVDAHSLSDCRSQSLRDRRLPLPPFLHLYSSKSSHMSSFSTTILVPAPCASSQVFKQNTGEIHILQKNIIHSLFNSSLNMCIASSLIPWFSWLDATISRDSAHVFFFFSSSRKCTATTRLPGPKGR